MNRMHAGYPTTGIVPNRCGRVFKKAERVEFKTTGRPDRRGGTLAPWSILTLSESITMNHGAPNRLRSGRLRSKEK